eukprot:411604-Pelagomonas_calceolata.AAC.5
MQTGQRSGQGGRQLLRMGQGCRGQGAELGMGHRACCSMNTVTTSQMVSLTMQLLNHLFKARARGIHDKQHASVTLPMRFLMVEGSLRGRPLWR